MDTENQWHLQIGYVKSAIMIIGNFFISKFIIENCEIREFLGKFADTVIYGNINVYCKWWVRSINWLSIREYLCKKSDFFQNIFKKKVWV